MLDFHRELPHLPPLTNVWSGASDCDVWIDKSSGVGHDLKLRNPISNKELCWDECELVPLCNAVVYRGRASKIASPRPLLKTCRHPKRITMIPTVNASQVQFSRYPAATGLPRLCLCCMYNRACSTVKVFFRRNESLDGIQACCFGKLS